MCEFSKVCLQSRYTQTLYCNSTQVIKGGVGNKKILKKLWQISTSYRYWAGMNVVKVIEEKVIITENCPTKWKMPDYIDNGVSDMKNWSKHIMNLTYISREAFSALIKIWKVKKKFIWSTSYADKKIFWYCSMFYNAMHVSTEY